MGISDESKKIKRTSAGIVILRQQCDGWYVLILRAWSHWDFPKGNVENGESLMQAAIREVKEETGITELSFPWGNSLARTAIYSRDKVAYYAIAKTEKDKVLLLPNPETGIKEHDEFKWVRWDSLPQYLSPRLFPILNWVAAHAKLKIPQPIVKEFDGLKTFDDCSNLNAINLTENCNKTEESNKNSNFETGKSINIDRLVNQKQLPINDKKFNDRKLLINKKQRKYKKRLKTSCSTKKK